MKKFEFELSNILAVPLVLPWALTMALIAVILSSMSSAIAFAAPVSAKNNSTKNSTQNSVDTKTADSKSAGGEVSQEVLVAREKRRLEELFIWKMSEELKLPVETETSFAEAIRSLNREKAKANLDVADSLIAIDKAQSGDRVKSKVETAKAVARYEKAWRSYGALPIREVARMRTILGNERLGRYLVAKSLMAEKLKALSAREALETEPPPETKSK